MTGEDGDLQAEAPFRLLSPVGEATSPLVFASPHSGRLYPKSAGFDPDLSELSLRSAEDALVDRLIEGAPGHGIPLLLATHGRAWLDLNRAPTDLDPTLIDDLPTGSEGGPRAQSGYGVVPRLTGDGRPLYRDRISLAEVTGRIKEAHGPYHATLDTLMEQTRAHDALSDVQATIALARLIRARQPKLFEWVTTHRDKRSAAALLDLQQNTPVVHVSARFPASQGCLSLVMPICAHPVNRNAVLVYDLRADPAALLELEPADLHERLFTPREDLPEDVERLAVKAVHINRAPVLAPAATLQPAQAERLALDLARCEAHAQQIRGQLAAVAAKLSAVFAQGEFEPHDDPEQDLYGGFVPDADRRLCDQVRSLSADEFVDLALPFADRRLPDLLFRYRARHYPDSLNDAERAQWSRLLSRRLEYAADGGLDLASYFALIERLRGERAGDAPAQEILTALQSWGEERRAGL